MGQIQSRRPVPPFCWANAGKYLATGPEQKWVTWRWRKVGHLRVKLRSLSRTVSTVIRRSQPCCAWPFSVRADFFLLFLPNVPLVQRAGRFFLHITQFDMPHTFRFVRQLGHCLDAFIMRNLFYTILKEHLSLDKTYSCCWLPDYCLGNGKPNNKRACRLAVGPESWKGDLSGKYGSRSKN